MFPQLWINEIKDKEGKIFWGLKLLKTYVTNIKSVI